MRRSFATCVSLAAAVVLGLSTTTGCGAEKVPPNLLAGWGSGPAECGEYTVSVAVLDSAEKKDGYVFQVKVDGSVVATGTLDENSPAYTKSIKTDKATAKVEIGEIIAINKSDHDKPLVQSAKGSPLTATVTLCPKKAKK